MTRKIGGRFGKHRRTCGNDYRLRRELEARLPIQNRFLKQLLNNPDPTVAPKDLDKNSDRTIIVNVSPSDTNWFVTARNRRKEWRIQQEILGTETTTPYLDLGNEVIAFRGWELAFDGQKFSLVSRYRPDNKVWTPGETTTASCRVGSHSNETIPVEGCACGIYATKDPMGSVGSLVGSVKLWGQYVEHEFGWRAQYAYPKVLSAIRCSECKTLSPFKECSISIFTTTSRESRTGISVTCCNCIDNNNNNDDSYRIPASLVVDEISSLYSLEVK